MNTIKFSHDYPKLYGQKKAKLLKVTILSSYDLHPDLIEYDTKTADGQYYKLPAGNLIQLIFVGDKDIPFCTIRRHTNQKWEYYKSKEGQDFEVVQC